MKDLLIWNMNPTTHYMATSGKRSNNFGAHLEMLERAGWLLG